MALTNAENQRRFKARMYDAGFRQMQIWIRQNPQRKHAKMDRKTFIGKLAKLTEKWDEITLSQLFVLFIKIAEAKKEVAKIRNKT
jgi:hypothetical protein